MYASQPIVVGLDFSEGSEAALVRAADLAERFHAPLHLFHASPASEHGEDQPETFETSCEDSVREFAASALGGMDVLDVIGPEVVCRRVAAADALVDYAAESGAGLLVVGTHGRRGVRHLLMGSVAEEVVRRAPCPVLTVPNAAARTAPGPDAPVLVPIDFAEADKDALAAARFVAAQFGAPVELVHVTGEPAAYPAHSNDAVGLITILDVVPGVSEDVELRLRRFDADVGAEPASRYHVRDGRAGREISMLSEEIGAGLVVMATHGLTGWEHLLLGSVTEQTLRRAPCPVLSLRGADTENGR